mmetsp:Transcript_26159/g.68835  ORF Transcript_26159/g.68835 Transcript_26159/m.68835 type:complete len:247 (-) Transcript_26159:6-746(-)
MCDNFEIGTKSLTKPNFKGILFEMLQEKLKRTISNEHVEFSTVPSSDGFVSTLTLHALQLKQNALWREAGVLERPCYGRSTTKKDAEQEAAKDMIHLLQTRGLVAGGPALFGKQNSLMSASPRSDNQPEITSCCAAAEASLLPSGQQHEPAQSRDAKKTPPTNIRTWCLQNDLPDVLCLRLEEQQVENPTDLVCLSDEDLDVFCEQLRLGQKGRFKRLVLQEQLNMASVLPVGASSIFSLHRFETK